MLSKEEYIPLPLGPTYIQWDYPNQAVSDKNSKADTLLLLHGATVPSWDFDNLVPHLFSRSSTATTVTKNQNYRILRIDLYGHGNSARPNCQYDISIFVNQVLGVLQSLKLDGNDDDGKSRRLFALGHSLGAAVLAGVASTYANSHNHNCRDGQDALTSSPLFSKLILVAPLLNYLELNPAAKILSVPLLGEILMDCFIIPKLCRRRIERFGAIGCPHLGEKFVEQTTAQPGFNRALLSMFRHGAVDDQTNLYLGLANMLQRQATTKKDGFERSTSIRVMWGSNDTIANEEQIWRIISMLKDSKRNFNDGSSSVSWEVLDGLEHNLLLSHPEVCSDKILSFLYG